jgi:hypothetical protein
MLSLAPKEGRLRTKFRGSSKSEEIIGLIREGKGTPP